MWLNGPTGDLSIVSSPWVVTRVGAGRRHPSRHGSPGFLCGRSGASLAPPADRLTLVIAADDLGRMHVARGRATEGRDRQEEAHWRLVGQLAGLQHWRQGEYTHSLNGLASRLDRASCTAHRSYCLDHDMGVRVGGWAPSLSSHRPVTANGRAPAPRGLRLHNFRPTWLATSECGRGRRALQTLETADGGVTSPRRHGQWG